MDLVTRLGGRKFLMAMVAGGFASYLEVAGHGLTPTMAAFLVSLVGAFNIANVKATSDYLDSKPSKPGASAADLDAISSKVNDIHQLALASTDPEQGKQFLQVLSELNKNIGVIQQSSGQMAQVLVNSNKDIQAIKRAVAQP